MGFLGGGPGPGDDSGIYLYVQVAKSGEKIRVRIDPANDLAQEFDAGGGDSPTHYTCAAVGDRLYVAGYDLSGDIGVVRSSPRILMRRKPPMSFSALTAKKVMYDPTLGDDGSLGIVVECPAGNGAPPEWGVQLTAGHRTDTNATTPGTGVDTTTTATQFGAVLYVQIFGFTGTSVRFRLRDSANGTTWANVAGAYSDPVTAIGALRLATNPTRIIRRYLQLQTTGTFSNCEFAAMVVRYATAQS